MRTLSAIRPEAHAAGPGTPEDKAISCLNAARHALTGNFHVLEFESQKAFDELRNALRAEHQPRTVTELLVIDRLAEHIWLSQRAQKFADAAFLDHDEKMMGLMLRFRTTHDRAFHKCLAELRLLRKERRQQKFESQKQEIAHITAKTESRHEEDRVQEFESKKPKQGWSKQEVLERVREYANANFERIEQEIQADLVRIAKEAEAAAEAATHISPGVPSAS